MGLLTALIAAFAAINQKDIKNKVVEACLSQPAAKTARELFVFVSRPDYWKRNNQMMLDYLNNKEIPPVSVLNIIIKLQN